MNMNIKIILIAVIVMAFSYGCATVPPAERPLVEKNFDLVELKRSLAETNMKVEELNNKFMLLQERVSDAETLKIPVKRLRVREPEDLKVVRLKSDEEPPLPTIVLRNRDLKDVAASETPGFDSADSAEGERPDDIYLLGQNYFFSGDYELARAEFSRLVATYPEHTLSDNALYWAGESYYSRQDYESAITFFERIVKDYPRENKAPDAMLKISLCKEELGVEDEAQKVLRELIKTYPHSPAALKAVKRLKETYKTN